MRGEVETVNLSPAFEAEKLKVLVIDDEAINRAIITDVLSQLYDVYLARDARQGFALAQKTRPDIILMDIVMPKTTGLEAITWFKNDVELKSIPVIFLTSLVSNDDEYRGLELGAVDYITKPIREAILKIRVATHLELVQKHKDLERLTNHDALTDIGNRRGFNAFFTKEYKRAIRKKSMIGLILCDVDYFKPFNDCYGHQAGDNALKAVAQAMKSCIKRPLDYVARYGGEEFIVVLGDTNHEEVGVIAEKLRQSVENLAIKHHKSAVADHVTISLGSVALVPNDTVTIEQIIPLADQQLYKAKETGRNRHIGILIPGIEC